MSRFSGTRTPKKARSRLTNNPARRFVGQASEARRARDLFKSYTAALGAPDDPAIQAEMLRAAELVVAAEAARAAYLAKPADQAMLDQVIRLENLSARALRRLGIEHRRPERPKESNAFANLLPELP